MRYIIYCDESSTKGRYFSNFYGGALIREDRREEIEGSLQQLKDDLNVFSGELKWTKISTKYEAKYIEYIQKFFEFVAAGDVKLRIMFRQNIYTRRASEQDESRNEYFMLYYQFVKHAFGLRYSPHSVEDPASIALFLDDVPQKDSDYEIFKDYMSTLSSFPVFRRKGIEIRKEEISSINSKNHNILQAVDIVLGSMDFRLNDKHLIKPAGQRLRGKRTRSKEKVYKAINKEIREIYPNFNIGASTGVQNGYTDRWSHPYRHWNFIPSDSTIDQTLAKGK